jgi:hypothetical protein
MLLRLEQGVMASLIPTATSQGERPAASTVALWLVVGLLALACFLLWRVSEDQGSGGAQPAAQSHLTPPPLPASRGTSAEAVVRQLDTTTRRFTGPLTKLQGQMGQAVQQLSFAQSLPGTLDRIANQTGALGGLSANLGALTRQTAGFTAVPGDLHTLSTQSRSLGKVRQTLASMLVELQTLRSAAVSLDELTGQVKHLTKSFDGATKDIAVVRQEAESLPQLVAVMRGMASDLGDIRRCTERPVVCGVPSK